MRRIWNDQDTTHVALSSEEALEIAEAISQASEAHPDCEIEVRFVEEDGAIRWLVKSKQSRTET